MTTLHFYLTGFAWFVLLERICRPFNLLRGGLCIAMGVSYFVISFLFRDLIGIGLLVDGALLLFLALAILSTILQVLLTAAMERGHLIKGFLRRLTRETPE